MLAPPAVLVNACGAGAGAPPGALVLSSASIVTCDRGERRERRDESERYQGANHRGCDRGSSRVGPRAARIDLRSLPAIRTDRTGTSLERQKALPVVYRDVQIDCGHRIDLLVEHLVIVELKAVAQPEPIHEARLLTYLKLSDCHVGLLIYFNVKKLKNGIRRLVNELSE